MVLLASVAASSQLRLESLLASLIIDRLLLSVSHLDCPVKVVPSVVTEIRRAVLELTDRFAHFDTRINDGWVVPADVDARLAALIAFEGLGLALASLLPVGAEPERFAGLDRFACCFGAGCVNVVLDFLGDVAGVADAVERVEGNVAGITGAVAAESLEKAAVSWHRAGVGKLREGEGAENGWDDG